MNFSKKSSIQIYLLTALCFIGLVVSIILSQHFYNIRNGSAGFKSFCNISDKMNCDVVTASPQAELFSGLPIASFSAGWFLAFFFISIIAQNRFWRADSLKACLGLSLFGTIVGLIYFFIMASQLQTYCMLCLILDTVNLLSLALVLSLKPKEFALQKWDWSKWKILFLLIGGSLFATVIGLKSLDRSSLSQSDLDDLVQSVIGTAAIAVPVDESMPSFGPKDVPITIVEFSDFQCPFCRASALTLNAVLNRYPDKIRVFFRNYPLNQSCNPDISQTPHPAACDAAKVALCAQEQNNFDKAYTELFEHQYQMRKQPPIELVQTLHLDFPQLENCVQGETVSARIAHDIEAARLLNVSATPTFFINGHKMEGAGYPTEAWNKIIDHLLKNLL